MENSEEKKIDDILKDIHNDFMDYFENIDIPREGSTLFHDLNNKKSIYELESDFHQSINLVRESLTKFKETCLPNEKDKKKEDLTLRKVSLILKDQNHNRQISKDWKSTCSDCLEALRQVCKVDKLQIMKKSLIELADDLKLQYFCDPYTKGLCCEKISLFGKTIVIDVGLDKDGNAILIELAPPEKISKIKTIESLLKNNLRDNNIKKFYEILSNIAYLDKHSTDDSDLFHNIQCIENTLTSIYEVESKDRAIPDIIQYGHGYPLISVNRFGPSVIYWGTPSALRQINWIEFSKAEDEEKATVLNLGFYIANITIINTKGNSFFLPKSHKNYIRSTSDMAEDGLTTSTIETPLAELQFITAIQNLNPLSNKTYCLTLDPPIIATSNMEKQILNILHSDDDPNKQCDFVDNNIQMFNSLLFKNNQLSIENLLVHDKFSSVSDFSKIENSFYIKKKNIYPQQYMFNSSKVNGIVVRHIPFTDPSQIYPIYKLLRQQLVFNTLFQSCMDVKDDKTGMPVKNTFEEFHVILEVFIANAPNEMNIIFNHPSKPGLINVTINIPLENPAENLKVQYTEKSLIKNDNQFLGGFTDMQDEKLRSEKLTQVLKLSYNIPLLVHYLMKCI